MKFIKIGLLMLAASFSTACQKTSGDSPVDSALIFFGVKADIPKCSDAGASHTILALLKEQFSKELRSNGVYSKKLIDSVIDKSTISIVPNTVIPVSVDHDVSGRTCSAEIVIELPPFFTRTAQWGYRENQDGDIESMWLEAMNGGDTAAEDLLIDFLGSKGISKLELIGKSENKPEALHSSVRDTVSYKVTPTETDSENIIVTLSNDHDLFNVAIVATKYGALDLGAISASAIKTESSYIGDSSLAWKVDLSPTKQGVKDFFKMQNEEGALAVMAKIITDYQDLERNPDRKNLQRFVATDLANFRYANGFKESHPMVYEGYLEEAKDSGLVRARIHLHMKKIVPNEKELIELLEAWWTEVDASMKAHFEE